MYSLLILDDDKSQLDYLSTLLRDDFIVTSANTPLAAYNYINNQNFDVIIVDVHMPIINGFDFIRSIKEDASFSSALFILSSDNSSHTRLKALNLGIKDFLWPEMDREEIILRIKNHSKREVEHSPNLHISSYKNIKVDILNLSAYINDSKLDLTMIEFKMLSFLINSANKICPREEFKEFVWPGTLVLDKTVNTHLTNLRSKLLNTEIDIKSLKGEGIILS